MKKLWIALTALWMISVNAVAGQTYQVATVVSLIADAEEFGGCMARLSVNLADSGINCTSWVTFDCLALSGQTTKQSATNLYSTAQLAFITEKTVKVLATDSIKVDGQCLATRIKFE